MASRFLPKLSYGPEPEAAAVEAEVEAVAVPVIPSREAALEARRTAVFRLAWRLSTATVTQQELDACPITSKEFVELCEERSVSGLCALPTCGERNKLNDGLAAASAKYSISLGQRRVYFAHVVNKFCGRECALRAEDHAAGLGSAVEYDAETGRCYVPAPASSSSVAGRQAKESGLVNVPTHLPRGAPKAGYKIETGPRAEREVVAVESRVREKKPSTSRAKGGSKKRVTFEDEAPGGSTAASGSSPAEAASGEQPVIYFEIENKKDEKGGKGGVQVGRLKVVEGGQAAGAAATEEDEGDVMEGPREAEGGGVGVDWRSGGHGNGADLPFNLTSLLPSSLAQRQEALRRAIAESDLFEERYPPLGGEGDDDTGGYPYGSSDENEPGEVAMGKFELSLSSFGTVWNFLNKAVGSRLLKYLDPSHQDLGGGQEAAEAGDEDHAQRSKVFAEQLSRVLPYVYQEMDLNGEREYRQTKTQMREIDSLTLRRRWPFSHLLVIRFEVLPVRGARPRGEPSSAGLLLRGARGIPQLRRVVCRRPGHREGPRAQRDS